LSVSGKKVNIGLTDIYGFFFVCFFIIFLDKLIYSRLPPKSALPTFYKLCNLKTSVFKYLSSFKYYKVYSTKSEPSGSVIVSCAAHVFCYFGPCALVIVSPCYLIIV